MFRYINFSDLKNDGFKKTKLVGTENQWLTIDSKFEHVGASINNKINECKV